MSHPNHRVLGRSNRVEYVGVECPAGGTGEAMEAGGTGEAAVDSQHLATELAGVAWGRPCRALVLGALFLGFFLAGYAVRAWLPQPLLRTSAEAALLGRSEAGPSAAAAGEAAGEASAGLTGKVRERSRMRLVINSHVKYTKPLNFLLDSMADTAKFDRWQDVLIVYGGSRADIAPRKAYVGAHEVVVVNTTLNAYDYTGLSVVWHCKNDPLVSADAYFYLHDSASVGELFTAAFKNWSRTPVDPMEIVKPDKAASNILIFGSSLVYRWRDSYDVNFTKIEAVALEMKGPRYSARGARPVVWWAKGWIHKLKMRVGVGRQDVYQTGILRDVVWYPDWDIYKYILRRGFGDITDGHKTTIPRTQLQRSRPH